MNQLQEKIAVLLLTCLLNLNYQDQIYFKMGQFVDLSFLKSFTSGDSTKMKKYITMFTSSAPGMMEKIQADCASSDWKALKTSSHSIKSQLKYMGAENAQKIAFEIEQISGEASDTSNLPKLVDQLNELCTGVIQELYEEVEKI